MCVFFPFILDIKFVGRTSLGHTGAEYHTGFSIHLLSAVLALIFLARRIQPFLSLVDREVEFCVLPGNDLIVLHPLGIFFFFFFFFSETNPVLPESNSRPNVSEGYMVTSQLPGRPARRSDVFTGITRHARRLRRELRPGSWHRRRLESRGVGARGVGNEMVTEGWRRLAAAWTTGSPKKGEDGARKKK